MHIPSTRIHGEMRSEEASVWFVPANGDDFAVLIKAPSNSIKALIAGCALQLVFGKKDTYACVGARICDMPDTPLFISGVQRHMEEHEALMKMLYAKRFPVFLFNEMDVCVAWADANIDDESAKAILALLGNMSELYVGPFCDSASHALDCFGISADSSRIIASSEEIEIVQSQLALGPWTANQVSFVSIRESQTVVVNDSNEGEMLERAVWAAMESVFPLTLYKSPQVQIGEKRRELTDVFSHHLHGAFLIEAKDLSVLQAGYQRNQDRKTKGTQKQISKAITQLVGAAKAFKQGAQIFDQAGNEIAVDRAFPPHCIVLVTELMHWGDWQEIARQLRNATVLAESFFHLMDFREFINMLKFSYGRADLLDYNLLKRAEIFSRTGKAIIRSRLTSDSDSGSESNT